MADHPLGAMLARGLCVSVHSDDPAYFGGYVDANFAAVVDALDLDRDDLRTLACNAVEGAFVTPERAAQLYAEIDAWHAAS
jgi:adenosine deaminase